MSDQSFQSLLAERADASHLRQAAVLIHALAPSDQRWAVDQLPRHHRPSVEVLLAELAALGLPRERAIVDEVLRSEAVARSPMLRSDVRCDDATCTIDSWVEAQGAASLVRALEGEPVALTARLLALREWPWRQAVLRQIQPALRHEVVEAMRLCNTQDEGVHKADEVLLDLLARRLQALSPTPVAKGVASASSAAEAKSSLPAWRHLWSRWRQSRSAS